MTRALQALSDSFWIYRRYINKSIYLSICENNSDQIRDIGVYHDCRLKYDNTSVIIVHYAYKRAV